MLDNCSKENKILDFRNIKNGEIIPSGGYCDQPYLIEANDGAWLLCMTLGLIYEGEKGQTVLTMRSNDNGKTWTDKYYLEPIDGPEASYAALLKANDKRIFCFYNHNTDNIRSLETANSGIYYRVDSMGHFVFKYSDDNGLTWSENRYEIPLRDFEIDLKNHHKGKIKYFWNVGKPFIVNGSAYVPLHKIGEFGNPGGYVSSEGALLCSHNLLKEENPDKIAWETLPEGMIGLRAPYGIGKVAEEQNFAVLSDNSIFGVYRTVSGYSAGVYSRDLGKSFCEPFYNKYPDGRRIKNPRAANFIWKCQNGKFIYWYHNNSSKGYDNRNPVWVLGGIEKFTENGNIIEWSQPELLLYDDDIIVIISYPDMFETGQGFYFTETQKRIARTHFIKREFFENIWSQFDTSKKVLDRQAVYSSGEHQFINIPSFFKRDFSMTGGGWISQRTGFSFIVDYEKLNEGDVLFDTQNEKGEGLKLVFEKNNFIFIMSDGQTRCLCETSENFINANSGRIAITVDGGPNIVCFIYNDKFCDGGDDREFGWCRFSPQLMNVNGNKSIKVGKQVVSLQVFTRMLSVSECVKDYNFKEKKFKTES